MTTIGTY